MSQRRECPPLPITTNQIILLSTAYQAIRWQPHNKELYIVITVKN